MAVIIRCRRAGANNDPCFRIVATDERSPRDGKYLELLGWYDPKKRENNINLKLERIEFWRSKGAQFSPTVQTLVNKAKRGITCSTTKKKQHKKGGSKKAKAAAAKAGKPATADKPAPAGKPTTVDKSATADKPVPADKPAPVDKPAAKESAKTEKPATAENSAPADKPAPADKSATADKPAPAT